MRPAGAPKAGQGLPPEIIGEDGSALIIDRIVSRRPRRRQEELSADGDEAGEVRLFPPRLADRRDKEAV